MAQRYIQNILIYCDSSSHLNSLVNIFAQNIKVNEGGNIIHQAPKYKSLNIDQNKTATTKKNRARTRREQIDNVPSTRIIRPSLPAIEFLPQYQKYLEIHTQHQNQAQWHYQVFVININQTARHIHAQPHNQ